MADRNSLKEMICAPSGRLLTNHMIKIWAVVAALLPTVGAYAADFQGLGMLPGGASPGSYRSSAGGISADGSTVVGLSTSANAGQYTEAFRWTAAGGMVGLGGFSGYPTNSVAAGVSANGQVVALTAKVGSNMTNAGRWTSGTAISIGDLPGGDSHSYAGAISANGGAIVGAGTTASGMEAFRWTESAGMVGLGRLAGGTNSEATGVSGDGAVVVGYSSTGAGDRAFRWTEGGGLQSLGVPLGWSFSIAQAISDDASTVIGWGSSPSGPQAFRWTQGGGMVALGDLAGGSFNSSAIDLSADGSVIVGYSSSSSGHPTNGLEASIWTATYGLRSVKDVLVNDYGITAVNGWTLTSATGVSADGLTIVGEGINPSGGTEAWIATIPEPSAIAYALSLAALFAATFRRSQRRN